MAFGKRCDEACDLARLMRLQVTEKVIQVLIIAHHDMLLRLDRIPGNPLST
jgi:hypothetical protein